MNGGFRRRTYVLGAAALVLLFGLTYWLVLRGYPLPALRAALGLTNPWLLALALLCSSGFILGEGACIHAILRSLGQKLSYCRCMSFSAIGVYFSAITPSSSGGQPAQVYYMNKRGVPVAQGTIAILLLTVIYKAVLLLVGLPLALIYSPVVFIGLPYFRILFCFGIGINLLLICGCLLLMFSKKLVYLFAFWVLRMMEKLRLRKRSQKAQERLEHQLEEYHAAAEYLSGHRKVVLKVTVYTILQRLSAFSVAYCVYRAFGLSTYHWLDVVAMQAAVSLAVDSLPLPGAVGASEGVFLGLYNSVYGGALVVPALLLTRGASYYIPALLCGVFTACYVAWSALKQGKRSLIK